MSGEGGEGCEKGSEATDRAGREERGLAWGGFDEGGEVNGGSYGELLLTIFRVTRFYCFIYTVFY